MMYVNYITFSWGEGEIHVTDYDMSPYDPNPSECVWIVPGTVDPRDD